MTAYAIAQRLLAVDDQPEVVEGQWGGGRIIVLSFAEGVI